MLKMNEKQIRIRLRILKSNATKVLNNSFRANMFHQKWTKDERKKLIDDILKEERELSFKLVDMQAE